jgi:hypothetical protein
MEAILNRFLANAECVTGTLALLSPAAAALVWACRIAHVAASMLKKIATNDRTIA